MISHKVSKAKTSNLYEWWRGLKTLLDIPVKVIVTDETTEKIIDCLDIATTLINDTGSEFSTTVL